MHIDTKKICLIQKEQDLMVIWINGRRRQEANFELFVGPAEKQSALLKQCISKLIFSYFNDDIKWIKNNKKKIEIKLKNFNRKYYAK